MWVKWKSRLLCQGPQMRAFLKCRQTQLLKWGHSWNAGWLSFWNEGIPEMQADSASASSGSPLQECQCPHPRALPYTKMASFKIKHYDLPKSSMDFFWIQLSLTLSQSCLEFNWWAIGEVLLGIGSKYQLFQPRKLHQKCQKVASLVECFSITFRPWTPLQFSIF